jgi:MFS family permease
MTHQTAMILGTVMGLTVAFPTITEEFNTTIATTVWIQLGYSLALAGGTFSLGLSSTLLDKRKLVIFGLLADVVLMAIIFNTHNIYVFIGARFLSAFVRIYPWLILQVMGIGGFPAHQRGKVLGIVAITQGVGMLVSIPLAGFVTEVFGWRWLFMGTSVFYLMLAPVVWVLIPAQPRSADAPKIRLSQFDIPGSVFMMMGMVSILASVQIFVRGYSSTIGPVLAVAAVVSVGAFIWVELRTKTPVVDFALFKMRGVTMGALQAISFGWGNGSLQLLLPFLFIVGYGWSITYTAGIMLFMNIVRPVSGFLSGWLSDRIGSSKVIVAAAVVALTGQLILASFNVEPELVIVIVALMLMGTGQAFMQTANQRQIFTSIPKEQLHAAPSTSLVLTTSGSATGQAFVGAALGASTAIAASGGDGNLALVSAASTSIYIMSAVFVVGLTAAQLLPRLLARKQGPVEAGTATEAEAEGRTCADGDRMRDASEGART